jgi:acyl-CoA synthetase (AMP-forming)/AMP-acid ligase II
MMGKEVHVNPGERDTSSGRREPGMSGVLTVSDIVRAHARLRPHKVAARDSRRSLTFCQWDERASRLAQGLLALGLNQGDRVGLLAHNRVEWMELYVALGRAGLVAVPINFRLTGPEIAYILQHSQARGLVVEQNLLPSVMPIREQLEVPAGRFVCLGDPSPPPGWLSYETLIEAASEGRVEISVSPNDIWAIMYTSGTTGKPKGAIRGHAATAVMSLVTSIDMGFTEDDRALLVMPMCHANSLNFSFAFAYLGATCIIDDHPSFDAEGLLKTLSEQGVTFTSLVPTHYIMILGLPEETKLRHDVSTVRKLMISSAPARRDTKLAIMDFFANSGLYELYGSTEAGWVTLLRPDEQLTKLGSIGREWTGSGAIKLLDAAGQEVPDGEVGELFSRTPYTFDGYWRDPEQTANAFRGEWCSVGDLARRDEDGYYHLVDRKSNMIISGGENIYPSEVENLLGSHPAVKDVAVIGVPHAKWGEAVHAVIVRQAGNSTTEEEVLEWCKGRIAGYKRPRSLVFIDDADMPRTATGKILHRTLREHWARSLG